MSFLRIDTQTPGAGILVENNKLCLRFGQDAHDFVVQTAKTVARLAVVTFDAFCFAGYFPFALAGMLNQRVSSNESFTASSNYLWEKFCASLSKSPAQVLLIATLAAAIFITAAPQLAGMAASLLVHLAFACHAIRLGELALSDNKLLCHSYLT